MSAWAEDARLLAGLRDGAWLDAQEFPPLAYAVPEVIPEGSVLLVGPPKIGKSWLVLSIALAAAAGGRALGIDIPKRPVLYLALEDGDRRLQDRCRRLLAGDSIPPSSSTRPRWSRAGSSTPSARGCGGTKSRRRW
jgi:RecA-family ATPase